MAYKITRKQETVIDLELNGEIIHVHVGGLKQYKAVLDAQEKIVEIQEKLEKMQEANTEITSEMLEIVGEGVLLLFRTSFGEATTDKLCNFFEDNYDEMLEQILPFLNNEFIPKLREKAREESKEHAKRLSGHVS